MRTRLRSEICQQRGNPGEDKANGARIETDGGKNGCPLLIAIFILQNIVLSSWVPQLLMVNSEDE